VLALPDGSRRIGDVNLVATEFLESATRPGNANGYSHARVRTLEFFCRGFGDGIDRARAIDAYDARRSAIALIAATTRNHHGGKGDQPRTHQPPDQ
jgi:hypothetical protein